MLKDLETLDKTDLDPDFIDMSDDFVKHVSKQLKAKTIQGRPVTGSGKVPKKFLWSCKWRFIFLNSFYLIDHILYNLVMGNLAKCYVEAIQNGAVPCIQSAVETTAQLENAKAVQDSVELYR